MRDETYVEVSFGWSQKFTLKHKELVDKWSLSEPKWKEIEGGYWTLDYSRVIIPLELADGLARALGSDSFDCYGVKSASLRTYEEIEKPIRPQKPAINSKLNIAIPGNALMAVSEVKVLEDCCTETLQAELDSGWCILAVCPQSQRRPDYVLGKIPSLVVEAEGEIHQMSQAEYIQKLPSFQPTAVKPIDDDYMPF